MEALNCSAFKHCKWSLEPPAMTSITKNHPLHGFPRSLNYSWKPLSSSLCSIRGSRVLKKGRHVVSPDLASPGMTAEHLRAREDAYQGVVIDPESLPLSANAFASALRASLGTWKLKEKRGVWLKILQEQAELVPIAIQEGFSYHHAEPGYVVLTYWIPSEPCTLPASPSHQIGIAGFVINDRGEILVVKEQCSCSCSGVWKLPTGYINKSEDIFSGAVREVKEETGVDTTFLEMVAFRHAHLVAFEKSDLMFVCLLKPLSFDITIDEKEIQAAKWMPVDEVLEQPFYREDQMSRRIIEVCKATYEEHYYCGFTAHQLISLFDGNLASCLYYSDKNLPCFLPSN
ncbi:nudix hydrolase 8-like [Diospyros lotus]|uniref:nudix hydrolase 8-like n=1 Tax=Diospyros lotus TaxID=55363 RepID=UPI00224FB45F|nr:nudix hydrolase 8-like [Diospyros lotus]